MSFSCLGYKEFLKFLVSFTSFVKVLASYLFSSPLGSSVTHMLDIFSKSQMSLTFFSIFFLLFLVSVGTNLDIFYQTLFWILYSGIYDIKPISWIWIFNYGIVFLSSIISIGCLFSRFWFSGEILYLFLNLFP